MSTGCPFVPDDILRPIQSGESKNIRLFQYVNSIIQEDLGAFLTYHALVYILPGVKQTRVGSNQLDICPGELLLILRGEYVMPEYTTGEHGFRSPTSFFGRRVAQGLAEQLSERLPERILRRMPTRREAVKIIPYNRKVEKLFPSSEEYSKNKGSFMCELIRLKFTELVYLLLNSPYRQLITSFPLNAAQGESPVPSTAPDRRLYPPATVNELTIPSGRSLSSSKREFAQEYGEAFHGWTCRRKPERAVYLLDISDKTIEEVTDASGFAGVAHLTRFFKEQCQMISAEYRGRNDERWAKSSERWTGGGKWR